MVGEYGLYYDKHKMSQEADDGGNIGISLNPDKLVNGFCQLGRMVDLRWDFGAVVLGSHQSRVDHV